MTKKFANYCNSFDAVIFGGGNFFEMWVDESVNNTSVNIPLKIIDKIKIPFYFFALGIDSGMGINKKGIKKFTNWIDHVSKNGKLFIYHLEMGVAMKLFLDTSSKVLKKFIHLLDGGF